MDAAGIHYERKIQMHLTIYFKVNRAQKLIGDLFPLVGILDIIIYVKRFGYA